MRNIIKELLNRKSAGTLGADDPLFTGDFTPLKPLDVENAEKRLGFQLTPLLSRVFTEVAQVSKRWFSWTDTYGIDVASGEHAVLLVASAVVIDQICHEERKH